MKHTVLFGQYAKSPCAYCRLKKVSLTTRQVRTKECLKKSCRHLVKYEHEFWKQREIIKQHKREKKIKTKG
jgi:hypothetical protein